MIKRLFFLFAIFASPVSAQMVCDSSVDGYVLDWNNYTWPGPGVTSSSFVVNRPSGGDPVTVTATFSGATGFFSPVNGGSPQISNLVTGGKGLGENSLTYLVDFDNTSRVVRLDFDFSKQVYNVKVDIFDIDFIGPSPSGSGGFRDQVIVSGRDRTAGTPFGFPDLESPFHSLPTTTQAPSLVEFFPSNLGRARGFGQNALPNENFGNITASFSDVIDRIRIVYRNNGITTSNPQLQGIAVYDISFCVPRLADLNATKSVRVHRRDNVDCGVIPGTPDGLLSASIPGSCVEYEIDVENTGEASANSLLVKDVLDDSLIFRGIDVSGFDTSNPGYTEIFPSPGTNCSGGSCVVGVDNAILGVGDTGTIVVRAEVK